jgi:hypothetical protein
VEYTWVHHAEINLAYLVKTKGVLTRKSYLFGGNFGLSRIGLIKFDFRAIILANLTEDNGTSRRL